MTNKQNLIPFTQRSEGEVREMNRKGGINSGKARLAKKRGRELMLAMLSMKETDPRVLAELADAWGVDPKALTKEMALNARQVDKAIRKADTNAFTAVHRVAGTFEGEETAAGTTINIGLNVSQEALDGLNIALADGARPRTPKDEDA